MREDFYSPVEKFYAKGGKTKCLVQNDNDTITIVDNKRKVINEMSFLLHLWCVKIMIAYHLV